MAYTCEKAVGPGKSCDFRSGRMILQQPIEREQMKKLLATGKTDLLTAFVSKKGRRFKAFLAKQSDGKIGFEFQAKAPKAPSEDKVTRPGSGRRVRSSR
jgi:DNA topoisomerase-3